jgi:DNA processing protein
MAVPGSITSNLSQGTNNLIKQGARLVEGGKDILEEIGLGTLFNPHVTPTTNLTLTMEEEKIYQLLSYELVSLDALIERTGLAASTVLSALMFLEIKGLVNQFPGKFYTRRDAAGSKQ